MTISYHEKLDAGKLPIWYFNRVEDVPDEAILEIQGRRPKVWAILTLPRRKER